MNQWQKSHSTVYQTEGNAWAKDSVIYACIHQDVGRTASRVSHPVAEDFI